MTPEDLETALDTGALDELVSIVREDANFSIEARLEFAGQACLAVFQEHGAAGAAAAMAQAIIALADTDWHRTAPAPAIPAQRQGNETEIAMQRTTEARLGELLAIVRSDWAHLPDSDVMMLLHRRTRTVAAAMGVTSTLEMASSTNAVMALILARQTDWTPSA